VFYNNVLCGDVSEYYVLEKGTLEDAWDTNSCSFQEKKGELKRLLWLEKPQQVEDEKGNLVCAPIFIPIELKNINATTVQVIEIKYASRKKIVLLDRVRDKLKISLTDT